MERIENLLESVSPKILNDLKSIDLSNNFIENFDLINLKIQFENIQAINLNQNNINNFTNIVLENIFILNLSKMKIKKISINEIFSERRIIWLRELDLSFNNIVYDSREKFQLENLERLNFRSTFLTNISMILYLVNEKIIDLDLSDNKLFTNESNKEFFRGLGRLQTLILKNTSLDDLEKIYLNNGLVQLDLSFNKLPILARSIFENLLNLKYLDLSFNKIYLVENGTFDPIEKLEYLNLENNAIFYISEDSFLDYNNINCIKLSFNNLITIPSLDFTDEKSLTKKTSNLQEILLNNNKIISFSRNLLIPFSKMVTKINLDFNQIGQIEKDAFLNLKLLEHLSISKNRLKKLKKYDFLTLFNLKLLNLSFNQIDSIEIGTFKDLDKLLLLDLNFNFLKTIPNNLFWGLNQLKDLYLMSEMQFDLNDRSFIELKNLKNIYLNDSLIEKNLCLVMKLFDRSNFTEKFLIMSSVKICYFRSLNILTEDYNSIDSYYSTQGNKKVFQFLQFNIHLNLKEEFQDENLFKEFSIKNIMNDSSSYYKQNLKKCSNKTLRDLMAINLKEYSKFSFNIILIASTMFFVCFILVFIILIVITENVSKI